MKSPAEDQVSPGKLSPAWLADPAVVRVFAVLGAPVRDVRAVGGCVRDAVMGLARADAEIDIGTPDPPDDVVRRLTDAGLRALPTGIAHGTVTALVNGRTFEITSLRRDTACDGRHAAVEFTVDWHEDARRRDFTFNAMSLTPSGVLHDDHGGVADARAGRVRFVGTPADRIREDYLRILRLFRFAALYARAPVDTATLQACTAHKAGLARLSGERIQAEMAKLLAAEDPITALAQMRDCGVLADLLPLRDDGRMLRQLLAAETSANVGDRAWLRRLVALIAPAASVAVADRLKLSNADRAQVAALVATPPQITPTSATAEIDAALFSSGAAIVRDRVLLAWSAQADLDHPSVEAGWRALLARIAGWVHRPLPIGGGDVLDLGLAPGPAVGRLLADLTAWWIGGGFRASRAEALVELKRRAAL